MWMSATQLRGMLMTVKVLNSIEHLGFSFVVTNIMFVILSIVPRTCIRWLINSLLHPDHQKTNGSR